MRIDVVKNSRERIYNIHFYNMTDLYDYIKSDPKINTKIFTRPASTSNKEFYGVSLAQATEYLLGGYEKGFENFILASKDLKAAGMEEENVYRVQRAVYGGVPVAHLVAAGVHDCMLVRRPDEEARAINIQFSLSYPAITDESKIINRGLATLFIVQALEEKGYIVNFNAFQISHSQKNEPKRIETKDIDEILYITINLKQPSDLFLNIQKCYYPIRGKEFLRRILFRVLESSDVTDRTWGENYGRSKEKKCRKSIMRICRVFSLMPMGLMEWFVGYFISLANSTRMMRTTS